MEVVEPPRSPHPGAGGPVPRRGRPRAGPRRRADRRDRGDRAPPRRAGRHVAHGARQPSCAGALRPRRRPPGDLPGVRARCLNTCDQMVTYTRGMDAVFRALADPTRRSLLDELYREDGQTLSVLEQRLPMSRFGVMKHLKVLEEANLVVTKRRGREKLHFLNPVPIRLVHDRWVSKYAEPWAAALTGIKRDIEEDTMEK